MANKFYEAGEKRAEKVNDDVTRIDKNPIGVRHALDVDLANAGFFELAHDVICQRADVTRRAARRHDQHVRE